MKADLSIAKQAKRGESTVQMLPWLICLLAALFYCYTYLLRIMPSTMLPNLMRAYHLNARGVGNLAAAYYYVYAPMQLFIGLLMDRYGVRRVLSLAAIFTTMGTYFFSVAHGLTVAEAGRVMIGLGSSFAFVGVLKLGASWLPPEQFGVLTGATVALGMLGAVIGDVALTELIQIEGWRLTTQLAAVAGLLFTVLIVLILKDAVHTKEGQIDQDEWTSFPRRLWMVARDSQFWITGALGCFLYLPISAFAELWGVRFLESVYHYSTAHAGQTVALLFLGMAVGCPLAGLISDRIRERRLPMTVGAVMVAILFSVIFYVPRVSPFWMSMLFFMIGFFTGSQALVFACNRENLSPRLMGTVLAATNLMVMLGGVVFQPLIGWLLDAAWSGTVEGHIPVYASGDYQFAMGVLPLLLVVAVFLTFFLRETSCCRRRVKSELTVKGSVNE